MPAIPVASEIVKLFTCRSGVMMRFVARICSNRKLNVEHNNIALYGDDYRNFSYFHHQLINETVSLIIKGDTTQVFCDIIIRRKCNIFIH